MTAPPPQHRDGTDAPPPVIEARFSVRFARFESDVDLRLPGRGISALYGPSGSGKSTILRVISGLERAQRARVVIGGHCWQDDEHGVFLPVHRRGLGYVAQDACLFPHLDVRANLEYGRTRRRMVGDAGVPRDPSRAMDPLALMGLLGIGGLLDRYPERLSGGERQRVAIARALLAAPRLLALDEPLAALDSARKAEILPFLERLHGVLDIPVLYVSHAADEVVRLADHITFVEAGRIEASGPLAATLSRPDLPGSVADAFGSIVEGRVSGYDASYGLLELSFCGGLLRLAHEKLPIGTPLRIQVRARDISLSRERPAESSILNMLRVTILPGTRLDGSQALVRCAAGDTALAARITRFSHDKLALHEGDTLWALVKSVALLV